MEKGQKIGTWKGMKTSYMQAKEEFGPAFISSWFYTSIGVFIGFVLFFSGQGLENWEKLKQSIGDVWVKFGAIVFEHLGIGFIVSAIAVFFYEWGSHIKKAVDLSQKLVVSLEQAKQMMEMIRLQKNLDDLNANEAKKKLHYSINTLIGGASSDEKDKSEYLQEAVKNCENLILSLSHLYIRHSEGVWANDKYIACISKHINEIVGHNANAFSRLSDGLQRFSAPPTAAQMADDILAAQMQAMEKGDRYDVISDLVSWHGNQLEGLFNETQRAIENRNVQIRRVFNLLPYIHSSRSLPSDYRNILESHSQALQQWKGNIQEARYEVRFLWPEESEQLYRQYGYHIDDVQSFHFGLFIHDNESVRFTVTQPDLSDMTLCRQKDNNESFMRKFIHVWNVAKPFPQPGLKGDGPNQVATTIMEEREKFRRKYVSE